MKKITSAGGVVINPERAILIVNQNHDSWSLPKGHIDPGESVETAARREIREESGIPESELKFIETLGSYERYRIGLDGKDDMSELKHITIIFFSTSYVDLKPEDPANPFARWVTIDEALDLLTHDKDKQFLQENREYILSFGTQK